LRKRLSVQEDIVRSTIEIHHARMRQQGLAGKSHDAQEP